MIIEETFDSDGGLRLSNVYQVGKRSYVLVDTVELCGDKIFGSGFETGVWKCRKDGTIILGKQIGEMIKTYDRDKAVWNHKAVCGIYKDRSLNI